MKIYFLLSLFSLCSIEAAEVCGETLSARWSYSENSAEFLSAQNLPQRFCEPGELFPGANVEILLLDSKDKIIFRKFAHFTMQHISHADKGKKKNDAAITGWKDFAIVKFPKTAALAKAVKFQINGLDSLQFQSAGVFRP